MAPTADQDDDACGCVILQSSIGIGCVFIAILLTGFLPGRLAELPLGSFDKWGVADLLLVLLVGAGFFLSPASDSSI